METFLQDLRYGLRVLLKQPGFTVVAVLTLTLGIGATTGIFSILNAVLFQPLPYSNPERLVMVWESLPQKGLDQSIVSAPNFKDWTEQNQAFESMAAFSNRIFILTGEGEPERAQGVTATASLFPLLGINPRFGNLFLPDDENPGRNQIVILGHGLWQRRFGADPGIVGSTITINNLSHTVVGIMPPEFEFPLQSEKADLWVPLFLNASQSDRRSHNYQVIARLKPDTTLKSAQAEMSTIAGRLEQQYPDSNAGWGVKVVSLNDHIVGGIRTSLIVLFGAVCFVLLIACANVANLLLARSTARQKEVAIRTALGANRFRLIRQFLTESLVLGLLGGILGLALAYWGVKLLVAIRPESVPRVRDIGIDLRVLGFTLFVALFTGIIFGLAPALQATKTRLNEWLKEGSGRSTAGPARNRTRSLLVVLEVALALLLLVSSGLMIKSFSRLHQINPGFNADNMLAVGIFLPRSKYRESYQLATFYQQVLDKIGGLPGVQSASAIQALPLSGNNNNIAFSIEGRPTPPGELLTADYRSISPEYFRTMGIPLLKGRVFTDSDIETAPSLVIVSETMANIFFPDEDPIGKRLTIGDGKPMPREVVGVVGDVKHFGLDSESTAEMYVPYLQRPWPGMTLVVRTLSDPMNLSAAVRGQVRELDKDLAIPNIRTMEQVLSNSVSQRRLNMLLLTIFAVVAIVLAAVGIYGVMYFSVAQRTHEIGVRMALGANRSDILKLILGEGLTLAVTGVAIGVIGAFAFTRVISSLLFGVSPTDLTVFLSVSLLLTGVALAACYIPAQRALRVDPMIALRYE